MAIQLWEAKRLADQNSSEHARQKALHEDLTDRAQRSEVALSTAHKHAYEKLLIPFAEIFARIKHVDLSDLPTIDTVPELKAIDVDLRRVSLTAVQTLTTLAGGSAIGAAAGGLTFAGVGAFAAASTGTAISSLSGAAATSATLAWLGGGSVASGGMGVAGGTAVLGGVVAIPVALVLVGFIHIKGKKELQEQRRIKIQLRTSAAELRVSKARVEAATTTMDRASIVLHRLTELSTPLLEDLDHLVGEQDDYLAYTDVERALVAELAGIATAASAVIASPLLDADGEVEDEAVSAIDAVETLADRIAA